MTWYGTLKTSIFRVSMPLLVLSACAVAVEEGVGENYPRSSAVDAIFASYSASAPGCAVGVESNGQLLHAAGYGMADLEQSVAIKPETVFYAASVSKQFTGMAAALLAYDGVIDLDAPISSYISFVPEFAKAATVRQALYHTTGLRDHFPLFALSGNYQNRIVTPKMLIDLINRQNGLNFAPGDQWSYSNSAYFLVAQVVEEMSGQNLGAFAETKMFEPLGMTSSHMQHNFRRLVPNRAHGYSQTEDGQYLLYDALDNVVGGGGLYTNIFDLLSWNRNFFDNKLGGDTALIETVETSGKLNSGKETGYGLGVMLQSYRGAKLSRHSGNLAGYRSELQRFPEHGLSIALLCNTSEAKPQLYAQKIADIFLGPVFKEERDPKNLEASFGGDFTGKELPMSKDKLQAFAGHYYSKEVDNTFDIQVTENGLRLYGIEMPPGKVEGNVVLENGQNTLDLGYVLVKPISETQFHNPGLYTHMAFIKSDAEDVASQLIVTVPGAYGIQFVRIEE